MAGPNEELVARAIAKDPAAIRAFVGLVGPVVHGRVAKALARRRGRETKRDVNQEIDDLVQEVFLALFDDDAKTLRAWDPKRSPLGAFVALVADHQVFSIFRSGRRRPWSDDLDVVAEPEPEANEAGSPELRVASREMLDALLDRLRAELTPKGFDVFVRLYVDEQTVEKASADLGMTADAIYAWRARLSRLVRQIASELDREMSESAPAGSTSEKEARASGEDR